MLIIGPDPFISQSSPELISHVMKSRDQTSVLWGTRRKENKKQKKGKKEKKKEAKLKKKETGEEKKGRRRKQKRSNMLEKRGIGKGRNKINYEGI